MTLGSSFVCTLPAAGICFRCEFQGSLNPPLKSPILFELHVPAEGARSTLSWCSISQDSCEVFVNHESRPVRQTPVVQTELSVGEEHLVI